MNAMMRNIAERGGIEARRMRGFTLASAVFLLVILAGLGAAMVNFATVEHASSALDIQGSRAYQAARAGIEWGLYQGMQNSSCSATKTFVPPAPTLSTFTVTVTCTSTVAANISTYKTVETLTATACNQPSGGVCPNAAPGNNASYVQRVVTITFSVLP